MKIKGTNDLSNVPFYTPFIHSYYDAKEDKDYIEAMVKVKPGEGLESVTKVPTGDTLIVVINIWVPPSPQSNENDDEGIILYTTPIDLNLPIIENPNFEIIALVIYDDPEEGGTATIRYGDIP